MQKRHDANTGTKKQSSVAAQFTGVWNIVPTPFDDSGEIDIASIDTLMDFVIDSGVTGMTILGVAGEASKLTDAERVTVIERMLARTAGRVPICVGVNSGSTHVSIAHARAAAAAGAHSVMLAVTPGTPANDAAITRHYMALVEAIDIPVVIQDHPNYNSVRMSVDVLKTITSSSPNLKVIKLEAAPTPPKVAQIRAAMPDVAILGGLGGIMLLEELRHGATGTMTGVGIPEVLVDIVRRHLSGDIEGATEAFYRNAPLIRFENQEPLAIAIRKLVYQQRGAIRSAHVRAPAPILDKTTIGDLGDLLKRLGFKRG
jgi:4-hydroxy-tetrahydrodipicolinate synthase